MLVLLALSAVIVHYRTRPLINDRFQGPDGLITNEFAYWHPQNESDIRSPKWLVTSGSLFRRSGVAWSGVPDVGQPDADSGTATNSAVFRMVSQRDNVHDATLQFRLRLLNYAGSRDHQWDGFHVFMRYQGERELYVISVARRDGVVAVKKKTPGGLTNGGSYTTLATQTNPVPLDEWQSVKVTTHDEKGGVSIDLTLDNRRILHVRDAGTGGPPLLAPGRIGFRADNLEFELDDVRLTRP